MQRLLILSVLALTACFDNHPELPVPEELCNGVIDNPDRTSPDGIDEPSLGDACDGPDVDLCAKGKIECLDGQLTCGADTDTTDDVELCNEIDDDCDGELDEGFDYDVDPVNCGFCGHSCSNANGTTACVAGACVPVCVSGSVDCNLNEDDGCEVFRDRNPVCAMATSMGSVVGDLGSMTAELISTDEAFFDVVVIEQSTTAAPTTATITLESPAGANFDLFVTCGACGGALMGSSTNGAGLMDTVQFRHEDEDFGNDSRTLRIEVRYISATTCGSTYRLRVTGGTAVATTTCP